jgi:phospholipase C
VLATLLVAAPAAGQADGLAKIETIVVIYAENRSFDHLYGLFPGANGIANATPEQSTQRDHDGSVLPYLQVWDRDGKPDRHLAPALCQGCVPLVVRPDSRGNARQHKSDVTTELVCNGIGNVGETFQAPLR